MPRCGRYWVLGIMCIRSVWSYEDPILDLPLPWRERIEVRGSYRLFRWFVCFVDFVTARNIPFSVIARSASDEAIQPLRSRTRASGIGSRDRKKYHIVYFVGSLVSSIPSIQSIQSVRSVPSKKSLREAKRRSNLVTASQTKIATPRKARLAMTTFFYIFTLRLFLFLLH